MPRSIPITFLASAVLLLTPTAAAAQSRYFDVWYFGDSIGLDFGDGDPVPVTASANTYEGCATICDPATGRILFYTNGDVVRNRFHNVMKNGTGLYGNLSATQAALIVPDPLADYRYFIFTLDGNSSNGQRPASGLGLNYSVVDMRADNGNGEVVEKNIRLLPTAGEKLVGLRHAAGKGYWIVTHELGNNRFHAWLLDGSAAPQGPVVSEAGLSYGDRDIGYLKASPDGTMLFALYSYTSYHGELFRFNPATGRVEELLARIDLPYSVYGASFSPDNNFLYVGEGPDVVQYDLRQGPDAIGRTVVGSTNGDGAIYGMQLAPDGRIYAVQEYDSTLAVGVIGRPNVHGTGCDFRSDPGLPTQRVTPVIPYRYMGLPNCIDGYFEDTTMVAPADTGCAPEAIRLRIGRNYRAATGVPIVIPVELPGPVATSGLSEIEFTLEYDSRVLTVESGSIEHLLDGTAVEGWNLSILSSDPGKLAVRLTAPSGNSLAGSGMLLRFACRLYLSNVHATELAFSVNTPNPCYLFTTETGHAEVDICGLNFRLIELTSAKYAAPVAFPNPVRDRVTFQFGLGLDGPTRLEVFDALGKSVGLIVNGDLGSGRYAVEWDVGEIPSGTYWYRLTSGDWSGGGQVRVE